MINKFVVVLINSLKGSAAFFIIVLLGELLKGSLILSDFNFEAIHFQIAFLGGILQGCLKYFKAKDSPV